MCTRSLAVSILLGLLYTPARADEALYRYEGDVLPYDESAGWEVFNPCQPPCSSSLEDGRFVLQWPESADLANYAYRIAEPPDAPPPRCGSSGSTGQITRSWCSTPAMDIFPSNTAGSTTLCL